MVETAHFISMQFCLFFIKYVIVQLHIKYIMCNYMFYVYLVVYKLMIELFIFQTVAIHFH